MADKASRTSSKVEYQKLDVDDNSLLNPASNPRNSYTGQYETTGRNSAMTDLSGQNINKSTMMSEIATRISTQGEAPNSPASPRTQAAATEDINIKPTKMPMSPIMASASGRRTFFDRTFGKLEKGSVRGSIFNLCSAALGGGVLSLPYVFVLSGWGTAFILLFIGSIASTWSNLMITATATDNKLRNLDEVCFKAGGNCLRKTLQIFMVVYVFGTCIGYQIFMQQLIQYIVEQLGVSVEEADKMWFRAIINIPIAVIVLIPLSLKRDMSSL